MICGKCNMTLIRINLFTLQKLTKSYNQFRCDVCDKVYEKGYTKVLHCFNCGYDTCPECAFNILKQSTINSASPNFHFGQSDTGLLYCGKKFTKKCLCGNCNGVCGPNNGCPCPVCDIILGYNICLNWDMKCKRCNNGNILEKATLKIIHEVTGRYITGFKCNSCGKVYSNNWSSVYHCYTCDYDVCQPCASKYVSINNIKFPPLFQIEMKLNQMPNKETHEEKLLSSNNKEKTQNKVTEETEETEDLKMSIDDRNKLDNLKCVICLENDKNMVFLTCNHMVCCEECGQTLKKCPLCRKDISSRIKVFM